VGNYLGAIKNWVSLLDEYDSIFCIVDYHAVTQPYDKEVMQDRIFDAAVVNIACGLDPDRCTLFVQSYVPEHTELAWILNCITPVGELERMTQFKQKAQQHRASVNLGLLDYPVLQAADILLYRAVGVPVGEDQAQHLELCREIVRKFNRRFGDTFPEPDTLFGPTLKVLGTDGKHKMSKSMGNEIGILETPEAMWEKLRTSVTDENRRRRSDPGDPDICNIYTMHQGFSSDEDLTRIARECRSAGIGCVDCKKILHERLVAEVEPFRGRAEDLRNRPEAVKEILDAGAARCKKLAEQTMEEVRRLIGLR
jgi:tryptophanyl-tRNA synthetase